MLKIEINCSAELMDQFDFIRSKIYDIFIKNDSKKI